jgi:hypothetical protein
MSNRLDELSSTIAIMRSNLLVSCHESLKALNRRYNVSVTPNLNYFFDDVFYSGALQSVRLLDNNQIVLDVKLDWCGEKRVDKTLELSDQTFDVIMEIAVILAKEEVENEIIVLELPRKDMRVVGKIMEDYVHGVSAKERERNIGCAKKLSDLLQLLQL